MGDWRRLLRIGEVIGARLCRKSADFDTSQRMFCRLWSIVFIAEEDDANTTTDIYQVLNCYK